VLKAIYLERGYQARSIPRLILEKNLYGLDIDDRAAQMAGFALLMKARADDRRLFTATDEAGNLQPPKLNVLSLQESKGLSVDELATHLAPFKLQRATIAALVETFEHAKTFGSLIQIPYVLKTQLALLPEVLTLIQQQGDMYASAAAADLLPLVQQAQMLAMQFDAVVANPPYMGNKYLAPILKSYLRDNYAGFEKDLFSAFMIRDLALTKESGQLGFMSPFVWMFISSYEELRHYFIDNATLTSLVQLEYSGFDGATVPICTFTLAKEHAAEFVGSYVRLTNFRGADQQGPRTLEAIQNPNCGWFYKSKPDDFKKIPGSPISYWASQNTIKAFNTQKISDVAETRLGMATADNHKFLRFWFEVSVEKLGLHVCSRSEAIESKKKWFQYQKGGDFRKWYGNLEYVVNWESDGYEIQHFADEETGRIRSHNYNLDYIFRDGVTWNALSSSNTSARISKRSLFDNAGSSMFASNAEDNLGLLSLMNSYVVSDLVKIISPTLNYQPGDIAKLPVAYSPTQRSVIAENAKRAIAIAKADWDSFETSFEFSDFGVVTNANSDSRLVSSWNSYSSGVVESHATLKVIEVENNRLLIDAYGLQGELSPEVPESQITLARAEREKDSQRLISYIIGCMMGRYSLDEPGLIYAHAGNVGFEPGRYATFPADADGIVPITDELWFADDAPSRIREFLRSVWGPDTLEENMAWLAESLGKKSAKEASETPDETIRRYIADKFFKDHLQTYKKRPIYWLFSSGKQGAFQALVYLHRYHEGTLARLRAEYVVPLTGKIQSRIEMLQKDAAAASSTAARNKLAKEVEKLKKKHVELLAYDEQLRHYADMRITLDLDDGVKVNYGKFGDLLEAVKMVTGEKDEE
jgi:hypothetical protein